MLWKHNDQLLPIGKWTNIRKENGQLMADAEFDLDDPVGVEVARKVEKGYLNATSIGFYPKTVSDKAQDLAADQTRPTVMSAELWEASIVGVPANRNAVGLSLISQKPGIDNKDFELVLNTELPLIHLSQPNPKPSSMKYALKAVGLPEDASEVELCQKIETLKAKAESSDKLVPQLTHALAAAKGLVNDANKEQLAKDIAEDPSTQAKVVLLTAPLGNQGVATGATAAAPQTSAKPNLAEALNASRQDATLLAGVSQERKDWGHKDWSKKDPKGLLKLKAEHPDTYKQIFDKDYGHVTV